MSEILIRPLVTEKMTSIQDRQGKFGFVVKQSANKIEIKKAIEKTYGVNVIQINTIRYDGKLKHRYTKAGVVSGRSAGYKKAIGSWQQAKPLTFILTSN